MDCQGRNGSPGGGGGCGVIGTDGQHCKVAG